MKSFWLKLFCNFPECRQLGTPLRTTGTHKNKKQKDRYSTDLDGYRDTPHGCRLVRSQVFFEKIFTYKEGNTVFRGLKAQGGVNTVDLWKRETHEVPTV
jgi:hypothetical protein